MVRREPYRSGGQPVFIATVHAAMCAAKRGSPADLASERMLELDPEGEAVLPDAILTQLGARRIGVVLVCVASGW